MTYSVCIICKNAEVTLLTCLQALESCPEVVLFDNGSTDASLNIAAMFSNVRIVQGEFTGFGPTKNAAITNATNDWILALDTDEIANLSMLSEVEAFIADDNRAKVGELLRHNYFVGKRLTVGGWGNDSVVRVFHRNVYRFDDKPVHERVNINDKTHIEHFSAPLRHDAIQEIGQQIRKINDYSELFAKNNPHKVKFLPLIFLRAFWAFFRHYIIQLGFTAGWRGFFVSYGAGLESFLKYFKVYAKAKR